MTAKKEALPTGPEIVAQMVEEPTLDRFFDHDPYTLSEEDLVEFVEIQRRKRALFISKEMDK